MEYEVSIAQNKAYILIKLFVAMTSEIGRQCGDEATRLGKEQNINTFLFDLRQSPNVQDVLKNYTFAYKDMEAFGFPRASKSALLVAEGDKSHEFIETVFRNAGYDVRNFSSEASAISWLTTKT